MLFETSKVRAFQLLHETRRQRLVGIDLRIWMAMETFSRSLMILPRSRKHLKGRGDRIGVKAGQVSLEDRGLRLIGKSMVGKRSRRTFSIRKGYS